MQSFVSFSHLLWPCWALLALGCGVELSGLSIFSPTTEFMWRLRLPFEQADDEMIFKIA